MNLEFKRPKIIIDNDRIEEEGEKIDMALELVTGGKAPKDPDGTWLNDIAVGTIFLVVDGNTLTADQSIPFQLISRTEKHAVLVTPGHPVSIYARPYYFSRRYRKEEELGIVITSEVEQPIKEEEKTDDEGNRV